MSRFIGVSSVAGFAMLLLAGVVSAQQPGPPALYNRPNVGVGAQPRLPAYLNLNNNNDPAVQYFLRTIPEQERRANTQIFTGAISDLELRALNPTAPTAADADLFRPLPTTGHPVAFQNTAGYFPTTLGRPAMGATANQTPPRPNRGTAR